MKQEYEIEDTWVSFEIHPDRPPEGSLAERQFSPMKYQGMMTSLRTRGAELGITFCERPLLANSRLAIEVAEYARDKGLHSAFSEKVFQAYFTNGRNIGELDVILDVASAAGLDREEVHRAINDDAYAPRRIQIAEEAKRFRIDSVPTFIINDHHQLVGAQPHEEFRKLFRQMERE